MGLKSTGSNPVFPTIHTTHNVYFFNQFKLAVARQSYFFTLKNIQKIKPILHLFKKLGLIRRFYCTKQSTIYVFPLFFKNKSIQPLLKVYDRKTAPIKLTFKALQLLKKTSYLSTFLVQTPLGLLTHKEAIKEKLGGLLVCIIH